MISSSRVARFSPLSIAVLIYGIIFLGFLPPVGMILLLAAWLIQRSYRKDVLLGRRHAEADRAAKIRAEQMEAAWRMGR